MSDYLNIVVSIKGRELGRYSFAKREVVIGRSSSADIVLENAGVSRRHAAIRVDDDALTVMDLNSNNGTFINGKPIATSPLMRSDSLMIGKFSIYVSRSPTPFLASSLSGPGALTADSEPEPAAMPEPEPEAAEQTVMVSPEERRRLLTERPVAPAAVPRRKRKSGGGNLLLVLGIVIGVLLAVLLL